MKYSRRDFIGVSAMVISGGFPSLFSQQYGAQAKSDSLCKPNIILIMADDLGYGDLSCFGSQTIHTPCLDELCANGMKLTDFHSNGAVCSPTRAALLTGRYQQRAGIGGVITAKNHRNVGMSLSEFTLAEMFKTIGYQTGLFGKWHLGYASQYNPTQQGFDEFKGYVSGNVDYHSHVDQEGYFDWWQDSKLKDQPGYVTHLITENCLDFIQRHKNEPFFLYVPHETPHSPIQIPDDQAFRQSGGGRIPGATYKPSADKYQKMIEIMDGGISKIVKKIRDLKLEKNTLIIFCSDNGPVTNYGGSAGGLRGNKGTLWEGGHRVPAIVYWPGKIKPGICSDQTIMTMDIMPTLASITQTALPDSLRLDGIDISPVLFSKSSLSARTLFWQYGKQKAVRQGKWKWLNDANENSPDKMKLYNLETDKEENYDLSRNFPDITQRMQVLFDGWYDEVTHRINQVS